VNDFFRAPADLLARAERTIKARSAATPKRRRSIRLEEQRKVDEAARKERERLEAIARETERKAREKAEAERKAADEAAAAGRAEEAARLREKAQATEQKAAEKAATFDERAATVVAPVITREPPKVAGLQMREVWEFTIVDAVEDQRRVHDARREEDRRPGASAQRRRRGDHRRRRQGVRSARRPRRAPPDALPHLPAAGSSRSPPSSTDGRRGFGRTANATRLTTIPGENINEAHLHQARRRWQRTAG
jgi:IgA-specific serine endopeptidase